MHPMNGTPRLEVNTPLHHYSESSSASTYSATTMDTDLRYASDTDDEEVDGDCLEEEEIEPKVEEVEEASILDVKPLSLSDAVEDQANVTSADVVAPKRGRGRPRKNPINKKNSLTKPGGKGRSKTGCITCRKRKKKCGEEKPTCKLPLEFEQRWKTLDRLERVRYAMLNDCV